MEQLLWILLLYAAFMNVTAYMDSYEEDDDDESFETEYKTSGPLINARQQMDELRAQTKSMTLSENAYFVPHETYCQYFYVFDGKDTFLFKCSNGYNFDSNKLQCLKSSFVDCGKRKKKTGSSEESGIQFFYRCPAWSGRFPHKHYCHLYYNCLNRKANLYMCPPGKLFDENVNQCVFRQYAKCDNRINPYEHDESEDSERPDYESKKMYYCPESVGTFPDPQFCHKFIRCWYGIGEVYVCPEGKLFDQDLKKCRSRDSVYCHGKEDPYEIKDTREIILVDNHSNFVCPHYNKGLYPHENCTMFYFCQNGRSFLYACLHGKVYDHRTYSCKQPSSVDCTRNNDQDNDDEFVCPLREGIFKDDEDCASFYLCRNGKAFHRTCSGGQFFDSNWKACTDREEVTCGDRPFPGEEAEDEGYVVDRNPGYNCKSRHGLFTHEDICNWYYHCKDGESIIMSCQEGKYFDNGRHRCYEKVDCGSRKTKENDSIPAPKPKGFFCPLKSGKFEHPTNCGAYYLCQRNKAILYYCPKNKLFHSKIRSCMDEDTVTCGQRIHPDMNPSEAPDKVVDPNPNFNCYTNFGRFDNDEYCNRYYECHDKKASTKECKKGKYYDIAKKKCYPEKDVNCGKRQKPHDLDAKTTTEISFTTGESGFVCPSQNGKFAHWRDCNSYYDCKKGKYKLLRCHRGKLFDAKRQSCENDDRVTCGTRIHPDMDPSEEPDKVVDPNPSFTCYTNFGRFDDDEYCNRYYECHDRKASIKECKKGKFYDIARKKCYSEKDVKCGNRKKPQDREIRTTTKKTIPTTKVPEFQCPSNNGKYPHERNCGQFYECKGWNHKVNTCPKNKLYNEERKKCEDEEKTSCGKRIHPDDYPDEPEDKIISRSPYYQCKRHYGRYVHQNCNWYYHCRDRHSTIRACEPGKYYDPTTRKCRPSNQVDCGNRIKPEDTTTDQSTTREENISTTVTTGISFSTNSRTDDTSGTLMPTTSSTEKTNDLTSTKGMEESTTEERTEGNTLTTGSKTETGQYTSLHPTDQGNTEGVTPNKYTRITEITENKNKETENTSSPYGVSVTTATEAGSTTIWVSKETKWTDGTQSTGQTDKEHTSSSKQTSKETTDEQERNSSKETKYTTHQSKETDDAQTASVTSIPPSVTSTAGTELKTDKTTFTTDTLQTSEKVRTIHTTIERSTHITTSKGTQSTGEGRLTTTTTKPDSNTTPEVGSTATNLSRSTEDTSVRTDETKQRTKEFTSTTQTVQTGSTGKHSTTDRFGSTSDDSDLPDSRSTSTTEKPAFKSTHEGGFTDTSVNRSTEDKSGRTDETEQRTKEFISTTKMVETDSTAPTYFTKDRTGSTTSKTDNWSSPDGRSTSTTEKPDFESTPENGLTDTSSDRSTEDKSGHTDVTRQSTRESTSASKTKETDSTSNHSTTDRSGSTTSKTDDGSRTTLNTKTTFITAKPDFKTTSESGSTDTNVAGSTKDTSGNNGATEQSTRVTTSGTKMEETDTTLSTKDKSGSTSITDKSNNKSTKAPGSRITTDGKSTIIVEKSTRLTTSEKTIYTTGEFTKPGRETEESVTFPSVKSTSGGAKEYSTSGYKETTKREENTSTSSFTTMRPIDELCKEEDGDFPHPEDCSKYYTCKDDEYTLNECAEGTLFDATLRICYRKDLVDCASRKRPTEAPQTTDDCDEWLRTSTTSPDSATTLPNNGTTKPSEETGPKTSTKDFTGINSTATEFPVTSDLVKTSETEDSATRITDIKNFTVNSTDFSGRATMTSIYENTSSTVYSSTIVTETDASSLSTHLSTLNTDNVNTETLVPDNLSKESTARLVSTVSPDYNSSTENTKSTSKNKSTVAPSTSEELGKGTEPSERTSSLHKTTKKSSSEEDDSSEEETTTRTRKPTKNPNNETKTTTISPKESSLTEVTASITSSLPDGEDNSESVTGSTLINTETNIPQSSEASTEKANTSDETTNNNTPSMPSSISTHNTQSTVQNTITNEPSIEPNKGTNSEDVGESTTSTSSSTENTNDIPNKTLSTSVTENIFSGKTTSGKSNSTDPDKYTTNSHEFSEYLTTLEFDSSSTLTTKESKENQTDDESLTSTTKESKGTQTDNGSFQPDTKTVFSTEDGTISTTDSNISTTTPHVEHTTMHPCLTHTHSPTPATGPPKTNCSEDDTDCIIRETGDIEKWFKCPERQGNFPHPSSKKLFIRCKNYKPQVKKCANNRVFSLEYMTCILENK